jgi:transcription elongation factor GreA
MSRDVDITPEGLLAVKAELDELTNVRRPEIVRKIKAARELGDLSENFEYHAAKNEQGFIESRIAELENIVKNHRLIEAKAPAGIVGMGSTVRLVEADGGDEETYRIVGPAEADPMHGRVSYESGMGKALIGHKVGEDVEVATPNGGSYTVRILAIS